MNPILVTGARGQVGVEVCEKLLILGYKVIACGHSDLDITSENEVSSLFESTPISLVINCAAYTAVDKAEDEEKAAYAVNALGPKYLAQECKLRDIPLIHISTDYVFDGKGHKPYTPEDETKPISVYGKTKRAGELAVLNNAREAVVIRTAWLYSPYGNNFVKTMRRLGNEKETINVVSDQIGTPTYAGDLAEAIVKIIPQISEKTKGVYHFTNEGVCSWYDFANEIMEQSHLACQVNPIPSTAYPTRATRPFYSVLDKSKTKTTFNISIQHWKKGLEKCLQRF